MLPPLFLLPIIIAGLLPLNGILPLIAAGILVIPLAFIAWTH